MTADRLCRFHQYCILIRFYEVQLFFHPVDEDLSPGTPDLTEKLRWSLLQAIQLCENG